ncbi:MAG: recombinase RecA [Moorella humiferrea]|nr:recombinase RecA [Moorella humiferrea]
METGREQALAKVLAEIEKKHGKGAIMRLGQQERLNVEAMPTGILPLDLALGVGGLPKGRIIEIFGEEGSGKTTIALHAVTEIQKGGGNAVLIDAEHAFDPNYAKTLGVDIDNLLVSQPEYGEQALEIASALIQSSAVDIIVIDSVAALVPKKELEGEFGDAIVGLQARLMSQAMRKLSGIVSKSKTIVIFINQIREKINSGGSFGKPDYVTPGGRALKFYSSVRIEVQRGDKIKNGTEVVGHKMKTRVVKNKVAPPFRGCDLDLLYGRGISKEGALLEMAVEKGIVTKSGAWYSWQGDHLGQGHENTCEFLRQHPDVAREIESALKESLNGVLPPGKII